MSAAENGSGEPACGDNAAALAQPAERAARRERRAERTASRSRLKTVHLSWRESLEIRQPEEVSGNRNIRVQSLDAPAFSIEGESQLVPPLPAYSVQLPAVNE